MIGAESGRVKRQRRHVDAHEIVFVVVVVDGLEVEHVALGLDPAEDDGLVEIHCGRMERFGCRRIQ